MKTDDKQADVYFISSSLLEQRIAKVIHGMNRPVINSEALTRS